MKKGMSIVEVMLAVALFFIFSTGVVGLLSGGLNSNRQAADQATATQYAVEGLEAARSLRNQSFSILAAPTPNTGTTPAIGLKKSSNVWAMNNVTDIWGKYKREIKIDPVYRNAQGQIVASGAIDPNTKKVSSTVRWTYLNRNYSLSLANYLTRWADAIDTSAIGGMAVFASGGTTGPQVSYRILSNGTGLWGNVTSIAAFSPPSASGVSRVAKVYSAVTRNEKVVISKHITGTTTENLYAAVWNGATQTWGSLVTLLPATAISSTYIDNRNFDATYLGNGDLMVVYGDNTTVPKMKTWNGSVWSNAINLPDIGGIPTYVALRNRLGTDEVMAVFFDQQSDTNSTYYNGAGYVTGNWAGMIEHATSAPTAIKEHVDFTWSNYNSIKGALFFANGNDKKFRVKIWTANENGGGSWGAEIPTSSNIPAFMGPTVGRSNSRWEQYLACTKNSNNALYCMEVSGDPMGWVDASYTAISGTSHNGNQRSYDLGWETISGDAALIVYSDNSVVPEYRKYDPGLHTFGPAQTTGMGNLPSTLVMVKICQQGFGDDMMVLMSDVTTTGQPKNLYSVEWNGTTETMYTTPVGRAFGIVSNGATGPTSTSYWFDFAWDTYW